MQETDGGTYQPMKTEMTETELRQGHICPWFSLTLKLNEPNKLFFFSFLQYIRFKKVHFAYLDSAYSNKGFNLSCLKRYISVYRWANGLAKVAH